MPPSTPGACFSVQPRVASSLLPKFSKVHDETETREKKLAVRVGKCELRAVAGRRVGKGDETAFILRLLEFIDRAGRSCVCFESDASLPRLSSR